MRKSDKSKVKRNKYRFVSGKKKGLPPGSLIHTGEETGSNVRITLTKYNPDTVEEISLDSLKDIVIDSEHKGVLWYDFIGVHEKVVLEKIGELFGLHPLVLEDIMNTNQRPKIEEYDSYCYIVVRMIHGKESGQSEQISIVLGENFVLTFQEHEPDSLRQIKQTLQSLKSKVRNKGPDYLAYRIIDIVIDDYFHYLEDMGERIEVLEEEVTENPQKKTLNQIHSIKRELILLRRSVWPAREVISRLSRTDDDIVKEDTRLYMRDVYDHTVQVIDTIESYRDIVTSLLDIYLSSISNRMGEVMKVLTVISTIFIPLTFISGVYGMNFINMPELGWKYGYFGILAFMGVLMIGMLIYFRRKGWV